MERTFKVIVGVLSLVLLLCGGFAMFAVVSGMGAQRKFACRSRQSEAKTNLSGLFTAEKAFFGEYNVYSTDLISVNWVPDGSPIYVYGFREPSGPERIEGIPALDRTRSHTADERVRSDGSLPRFNGQKMKTLEGRVLTADDLVPESKVTETGFLISAAGDIDPDDGKEILDVWTIDEAKNLTVVHDDCDE